MELLDRYLHALKTYLPKAQQRDIIAELSDTIQSEAEELERTLGRPLNQADEVALLKRYGHPLLVAGRYRPQQYLIGPTLFPYYGTALKLMAGILVFVHVVIAIVTGFTSATPTASGLAVLGNLWNALIFWFCLVTVVFALLERNQVRLRILDHWNPSDLVAVPGLPDLKELDDRRLPWSESIPQLVLSTLILLYWLGVPPLDTIRFGGDGVTVRLAPVWHRLQLPITVFLLMGVARNLLDLVRPYWTTLHGIARLVTDGIGLTILYVVLRAQSFVVIADAAGNPGRYAEPAAILNRVLGYVLLVTAAVFVGDVLLNLWRLAGRPAFRRVFRLGADR